MWKKIKGYNYIISTDGNIRRFNPQKTNMQSEVEVFINIHGYKYVMLWKEHKCKKFYIHKLVAETFIKNYDNNKICIDHINRLRDDNRQENLRWVSYSENIFPSQRNAFSSSVTFRDTYDNEYWRDSSDARETLGNSLSNLSLILDNFRKALVGSALSLS